jgi:hypothetical protein
MTHESADASVAVQEGLYVVESMVSRGHRHELCSSTHLVESESLLEIPHEVCDACARRRYMPTNSDVIVHIRAPLTRGHP